MRQAGIARAVGRLERPSEKPGAILTRVRVHGTASFFSFFLVFSFFLSPESASSAASITVSVQPPAVCNRMHPQEQR